VVALSGCHHRVSISSTRPNGGSTTDYPFDMGVTDPVERAAAAGLPAADLTAILGGNAATLFGIG
jgi:hypothetical protein